MKINCAVYSVILFNYIMNNMDNINKYVLFYSMACEHSRKLLDIMEKNGLESSFTKVNIDFTDDIPNFVTHVPTVLVDKNTKMQGQAVFEWISKLTESTSLQPTSIDSMTDPYSFISDNGDGNIHTSYSLLDFDYGGGPSAGKSGGQNNQQQQQRNVNQNYGNGRSNGDDMMQRIMDSRKSEVPQMVRRV